MVQKKNLIFNFEDEDEAERLELVWLLGRGESADLVFAGDARGADT